MKATWIFNRVSSCSIVYEHSKWIAKTDRRAQHAGARDLNFNESISDRRVHPRYEPHSKGIHYLRPLSRESSGTNRSRARWREFAASLMMVARLCEIPRSWWRYPLIRYPVYRNLIKRGGARNRSPFEYEWSLLDRGLRKTENTKWHL